MDNPFELKLYDKNFAFKGYIGNPVTLSVTPRFNDVGTATIEIDTGHRLVPDILAEGSRLVISKDGVFLLSGRIYQKTSEGPSIQATLKLFVRSDFQLLKQVLLWPNPAIAVGTQGPPSTKGYVTAGGSMEALAKDLLQQNMVTRLGLPVTVATNLNRGGTILAEDVFAFRFQTAYDKLFPLLEQKGLGMTFQQQGSTIVCDVFTPPTYGRTLTEESGALQSWAWTAQEPAATRIIATSKGAGTDEYLATLIGSSDGLEAAYNTIIETYDDIADADTLAKLNAAAAKKLDDMGSRSGFAVRLAETDLFRYGQNGLVVGALVTISVGGITRTDYLREVTMTYSRDDGVEVTPVVGEIQDSPDRSVAKFLARLMKSINELKGK